MKFKSDWLIKPKHKVSLDKLETKADGGYSQEDAAPLLAKYRDRIVKQQEVLYAGQKRSILLVLQGMDTAGKDGAIAHLFSGVNPQGCQVTSFKVPTPLEARHDFLWRCHAAAPAAGMIGIFNRSHYEEVLFPRVHKQISHKDALQKMDGINDFERLLTAAGTQVIKFFLHVSHDEQKQRLQARLDDPEKLWKFSAGDLKEREFWPDYQKAYADLLSHTSTPHAPWFAIPADRKWFRNLAISKILADTMTAMKLKYPVPTVDPSTIKL